MEPSIKDVFINTGGSGNPQIIVYVMQDNAARPPRTGEVLVGDHPDRLSPVQIESASGNAVRHTIEMYADDRRLGTVTRDNTLLNLQGGTFQHRPDLVGRVRPPQPRAGGERHAILYVGFRADGAYMVATRTQPRTYYIHVGRQETPMTTLETRPGPERDLHSDLLPRLDTDRGTLQQSRISTTWEGQELRSLNPRDYRLERDDDGRFVLVWA